MEVTSDQSLREAAFDKKIAAFGLFFHSLPQLSSLRGVTALSWEWWWRVGSIPFVGVGLVWPALHPASYLRCRTRYLLTMRVAYFLGPLFRSNSGVQRVLDAQASPGALGLAGDLVKIAWGKRLLRPAALVAAAGPAPQYHAIECYAGCRLVAVVFASLVVAVPVPLHLALVILNIAAVRSNATFCHSTLLTDPLMVHRLSSIHHWAAKLAMLGEDRFSWCAWVKDWAI